MLVVKQMAHAPYASVLVPVDFSPASPAALQCAGAVAPGARLRALHAVAATFEGKLRNAGVRERVLREYRSGAERDARERMAALRVESGPVQGGGSAPIPHGRAGVRTPDASA